MRRFAPAILFLALASATCRGTGTNDFTPKEIESARRLYVGKCAKCHKFYEPRNYTAQEWQRWMESMSRKSKLKPEQESLLGKYWIRTG